MKVLEQLKAEFELEFAGTKKLVEALKNIDWNYKPHEKSMSVKALINHVVDLTAWPTVVLEKEELDLVIVRPSKIDNTDAILEKLENIKMEVIKAFDTVKEENLNTIFKLKMGDFIIMEAPKYNVLRSMINNHIYHHRGQLSVYLRLNNLPVPGLYGPSADEQ